MRPKPLECGAYAVGGNVDPPRWPELFAGTRVTAIDKTRTVDLERDDVCLTALGMDDSFNRQAQAPANDRFHIALGHSPDFSLSDAVPADLLVAGHTHGGGAESDRHSRMSDDVDVLIVGSGGAGMMAALRAADLGLKPLIIEKAPLYGGTTATSGGIFWTPCHGRGGLNDTPARALEYLRFVTEGEAREERLRAFVEN